MSTQRDEMLRKDSGHTTEEDGKDSVPLAGAASSHGEEERERESKQHNSQEKENPSSLSFAWRMLLGTIRKTFPKAKQLKTRLLNEWMADEERRKHLMLFDARELDEHAVSFIDGSIYIKPDGSDIGDMMEKIFNRLQDSPKPLDVICYCSVGYRSAKMAEIIEDKIQTCVKGTANVNVYNLEGSLFKWANEKRPMVDQQGKKTIFCHPYSTIWGKFLDSDLRKWTP